MGDRLNPATLKSIRVQRNVDVGELAAWLKVDQDRVLKFESGEATPTINQLARMSRAFKVPLYAYKNHQIPNLEPVPDDFRKRLPTQADLSPAGLARLWSVEQIADFSNELLIALKEFAPPKSRLPLAKSEAIGKPEEMRHFVDLWMRENSSLIAKEKSEALTFSKNFRIYIERHGCMICYDDAPSTDYLGFYKKFNRRTPLAFVNRQSGSQKASLFTLAHEWAHFLCDEEGISNPWISANLVEKKCNRFAAEFLAPESSVRTIVDRHWSKHVDPADLVSALSRSSLLSFQASAIRLSELSFLTKAQVSAVYKRVAAPATFDNETDPPPERSGGNINSAAGRRLAEVGVVACAIAAEAVDRNIVDDIDVAQGLRISPSLQPHVFRMARKRYGLDAG